MGAAVMRSPRLGKGKGKVARGDGKIAAIRLPVLRAMPMKQRLFARTNRSYTQGFEPSRFWGHKRDMAHYKAFLSRGRGRVVSNKVQWMGHKLQLEATALLYPEFDGLPVCVLIVKRM